MHFRFTAVFAICFLAVVPLMANGFYGNGASARTLGMAGIYTPSTDGVLDAIALNPAGLPLLNAKPVDLSLAAGFARGRFDNATNHNAKLSSAGVLPYGAFGAPIGSTRFSFGAGVVPELMSSADWQYVDTTGAAGASYGLTRHKSAIYAVRSSAGVGVYLGPALSIGATVGVVYNSNTLQAPYIFQSHPALTGLKTQLDLRTSGTGLNTAVGAIVRPMKRVRLNVAWRSQTVINSEGRASGNLGPQLAAIGLAARPDFEYSAQVRNVMPQSVIAGAVWEASSRWKIALQADWVNWKGAFARLPVSLTRGTNADINGLLKSDALADTVPLHWKDQVALRAGIERSILENTSVRTGFAHSNNPVPSSTLTPLTAAIMKDTLSAGLAHRIGRWRFDLAYTVDLSSQSNVRKSALAGGEYNSSTVRVGTQALVMSTSVQF